MACPKVDCNSLFAAIHVAFNPNLDDLMEFALRGSKHPLDSCPLDAFVEFEVLALRQAPILGSRNAKLLTTSSSPIRLNSLPCGLSWRTATSEAPI